tara:strand:+ start:99 stop:953 length:855 start_codon:yes stop_codon:yes gene_type:complete
MPKLHKTKTFKKGLKGGFKPGFTGSKPSGKIKRAAKDIKRKVDSKVSEVKKDVKSKVNKAKDKVNEIKTKREVKKNPPKKEKVYNPSTYSQSGTGDMDSRTSELSDMLSGASMKKFPEIKEKNEGKFTKWVEKNMGGMDTCKAASKIMRSRTKKYSPAVVKMANYANNFGCKTKKEDGASMKKPRGTKEEMAQRKIEKRNDRVTKRIDKSNDKMSKKSSKIIRKEKAGKITQALGDQKLRENFYKSAKKDLKPKNIYGSRKYAKAMGKTNRKQILQQMEKHIKK